MRKTALSNFGWIFTLTILGAVLFIIGENYFPVISSFSAGIFSVSIILFIWHYVDDMILGNVNTYKEIIEKGNIAYAIYTFSLIVLICFAYLSAFTVFYTLAR